MKSKISIIDFQKPICAGLGPVLAVVGKTDFLNNLLGEG